MTQPSPEVWPECSDCHTAYVLRRAWSFGAAVSHRWVWMQDCKHGRKGSKQPDAVIATADGPLESDDT